MHWEVKNAQERETESDFISTRRFTRVDGDFFFFLIVDKSKHIKEDQLRSLRCYFKRKWNFAFPLWYQLS